MVTGFFNVGKKIKNANITVFKSINLLWDVTYAAVKVHEKETGQPILAFE